MSAGLLMSVLQKGAVASTFLVLHRYWDKVSFFVCF